MLRVTNGCDKRVERWLGVLVMYVLENGHIVWDSATELPPPAILEIVWFEPGGTRNYKLGWNGISNGDEITPKGNYEVVVRLGVTGPEFETHLNLDSTKSLSIN